MGVEEEHIENLEEALSWYEKSYRTLQENGVVDENLFKKFKAAHIAAQDVKIKNLNS
jgi:hypothetical protein